MKQWWTIPELADKALPGIAWSKRGLDKLAKAKGWRQALRDDGKPAARTRKGRGGGWEYHISLLPLTARAALVELPAAPAVTLPEIAAPDAAGQRVAEARVAILDACATWGRAFAAASGQRSKDAAYQAFAEAWAAGTVTIEPWVREAQAKVSRTRLYAWEAALKSGDGSAIAGRQGRKAGSGILDRANDGSVATLIGALIIKQPFLSAEHIRDQVVARFGATLDIDGTETAMPEIGAFRRFVAAWRETHKVALTKLTDPDRFKSHYRVAGLSRHAGVERVNQLWQIDASPADVLTLDGRYSIYVLIDVYSRRMMASVTRTPRTAAVLALVRKAILAWGVPEGVQTDNGSDFASHAARRAFIALGIPQEFCTPFQPQEKGIIERGIGTVQRGFMTLLPGFIGHSVADRKSIEARKAFAQRLGCDDTKAFAVELDHAELAAMLDTWLETKYAHQPHSAFGKQMSPFAKAQTCTAPLRRVESERALDVMLYEVPGSDGIRTVAKQGIRVDGAYFIAPTLMVGEKVLVRLDPDNLGRVLCFSPDGARFLAEAVNPEAHGIDRGAAVAMARAEQKRMIDEQTAAARAEARTIKPRDMIGAVLRKSAEDAGKLVSFPKRAEAYDTPALTAAAESLRKGPAPAAPLDAESAAAQAEAIAEFEARLAGNERKPQAPRPSAEIIVLETEETKFLRALDLQARAAAGSLADDQRAWLDRYQQSAEYQTQKSMLDQFGDAFLDAVRERARRTA